MNGEINCDIVRKRVKVYKFSSFAVSEGFLTTDLRFYLSFRSEMLSSYLFRCRGSFLTPSNLPRSKRSRRTRSSHRCVQKVMVDCLFFPMLGIQFPAARYFVLLRWRPASFIGNNRDVFSPDRLASFYLERKKKKQKFLNVVAVIEITFNLNLDK